MKTENPFQQIDEKFQSFHEREGKYKHWFIHSFDFFGCDYGFSLWYKDGVFWIEQLVDSGYNKGKKLLETDNLSIINDWLECFAPTNPKYKTQRK